MSSNSIQQKDEVVQNTETPIKSVDEEATVNERLTDNAVQGILPARYLQKDSDGNTLEDPSGMFRRVADNVAGAELTEPKEEKWSDEFYKQMTELRFMPNSPTLMNAGTDMNQLSACFVLTPQDDMEDIFEKAKDAALIFQSGGGVGYSFSDLRPKGAYINSTGGEASGPVSFMKVFDETCNQVKQGGCIAANSRVMTDDGYKPLSSVHNAPPLRDSRGGNKKVQARDGNLHNVVESSDSGPMPASKLTTSSGYELVGTPNHKVFAVRDGSFEFVPIEDLESGDTIVMDMTDVSGGSYSTFDSIEGSTHGNATIPNFPEKMTDDVARMLGTLWGDGAYNSSQNRLVFTFGKDGNGDTDAKDFIVNFFNEIGISPRVVDEEPKGKGAAWRVVVQSKNLITWMDENGLDKKKDNISQIPEKVYESPNAISSFLGGLTCDAHVAEDAGTVTYSTADEEFAKLIQELLLLNGIPTNRYSIARNEASYSDKPCHCVQVFTGEYARQYDEMIPHYLDGDIGELGGERQNQVTFADELLTTVLGEHFEKGHKLPDHVDRTALKELRRYERGDRTPSKERLVDCLERVGIEIEEVPELDGEYLYETIESIESVGEEYVYDIEVMDGAHEFVASNFIVHNKRRGAQMAILRVDHPDIGRFAVSKRSEGDFANFNISAGYTDEFVEAVENGETYTLYDPTTDYEDAYNVREETRKFYLPSYQDNPKNAYDDGEGAIVDENIWRDHADEITTEEGVSLREKWESEFTDQSIESGEAFELPAEFVWDIMIDGAYQNGEPGLFYLDETNREHSFDVDEYPKHEINATNPCAEQPLSEYEACLHGEETILTEDGIRNIEDFTGGFVSSDSGPAQISSNAELIPQGRKETVEVTLDGGMTIQVTPDHTFMTDIGEIEAQDLVDEGASVKWMKDNPLTSPVDMDSFNAWRAFSVGWIHGDGWLTENSIGISFNEEDGDFEVKDRVLEEYHEMFGNRTPLKDDEVSYQEQTDANYAFDKADDLGFNYSKATERSLPDWFYTASENEQLAFLRGLFTADSGIGGKSNTQIQYSTSSYKLTDELQKVLGSFGIQTRRYITEFDDRNDQIKLSITTESADKFMKYIGIETEEKREQFNWESQNRTDDKYLDVISVEKSDSAIVYDLTVPKTHVFHTNGVLVHNCNLGHINLSLVLEEDAIQWSEYKKHTNDGTSLEKRIEEYFRTNINFSQLDRTIEAGVRFLDDVVTQSDFPIDEIEDRVSNQRKIGLGIMGFAQMLYQMGVPYGSKESYEIARQIMRYIDRKGTDVSNTLAKERGPFGAWSESKYANPLEYKEWFESHTGLPAEDYPKGFPIRNHNITTIAPTGTTSMLGNTSGGCEPVYNVANFKNVGNDIQGDDVLVEFDDYFLQTLRANDLDVEAVKEEAESLMRENKFDGVDDLSIPDDLADVFVTTQDLSSRQHGLMQRAFQEFCDSGISKTINMPHDATRGDVGDAYHLAFEDDELGDPIKGLTVYRDGSRDEQVLTTRMDNGLEDSAEVNETALDLFLSGEISEKAAQELGVVVEGESAECPQDGCEGTLQPTDDCSMCDECYYSPCS